MEPYAYAYEHKENEFGNVFGPTLLKKRLEISHPQWTEIPLYTRPANDEPLGAAAPTPPEDEPVVWHVKDAAFKEYNGTSEFYGRDKAFFNAGFDAGYKRRPDNGELRKAAAEATDLIAELMPNSDPCAKPEMLRIYNELRAALDKGKS